MKKVIKVVMILLVIVIVLSACNYLKDQDSKNEIVIFGDYKCPYCKQLENKIMPELEKDYIKKGEAKVQFINVAFLGKDSVKGSRAGHAVENVSQNKYLDFQKNIFNKQPNHEGDWITNQVLDKEIDELAISDKKKDKIKKDYKTKNSQSWKDAEKDMKLADKKNIEEVPTIYINDKKVEDPYNIKEYRRMLEN